MEIISDNKLLRNVGEYAKIQFVHYKISTMHAFNDQVKLGKQYYYSRILILSDIRNTSTDATSCSNTGVLITIKNCAPIVQFLMETVNIILPFLDVSTIGIGRKSEVV